MKNSGFQRALGCRKRLAAQLATCSDALGNWLARAAIVGGAFVLRVPPGALFLSDLVSKSISQLSYSDPSLEVGFLGTSCLGT